MVHTAARRIAGGLQALCGVLILCDVLLLPLVPALAYFRCQGPESSQFSQLMATFRYDFDDGLGNLLRIILLDAWRSPEVLALALFLLLAGVCGAVILAESFHLLGSVAADAPFSPSNAVFLRRASACCFLISAGALARTMFSVCVNGSDALLSYTALAVPLFVMAGLLGLVMAGLFAQAAEIKAENDLTI